MKSEAKLVDYLGYLDLFKRPVLLYIGEFKFHSTKIGLVISIFIYGYLIFSFFVSDMFLKSNPTIYDQTILLSNRPHIKIEEQLAIYVSDINGLNVADPSIFTVRVVAYEHSLNKANNSLPKTIEHTVRPCTKDDFDAEELARYEFGNSFCTNNKTMDIQGYWDEKTLQYVHIFLEKCNNHTSEVTCKNEDEINQFLSDKYFGVFLPNNFFDMGNYNEPLNSGRIDIYQQLDLGNKKRMKIFVKTVEFLDDRNYVFSEKKGRTIYTYDFTEIDITSAQNTTILNEIYIYSSNNFQRKIRTYQKVPEVLAQIGGQANALMIIGIALTSLHSLVEMTIRLINSLYQIENFKEEEEEAKGKTAKKKEKVKIFPDGNGDRMPELASSKVLSSPSSSGKGNVKKTFQALAKLLRIRSNDSEKSLSSSKLAPSPERPVLARLSTLRKMKQLDSEAPGFYIGVETYMKIQLGKCIRRKLSKKERIFQKAEQKYCEEVNIINILKRLQELEKLKVILLSPEQLSLFSMIEKPMIHLEKEDEIDLFIMEDGTPNNQESKVNFFTKPSVRQMSKLMVSKRVRKSRQEYETEKNGYKYYLKLKNSPIRTELDQRLLFFIESKLDLFENKVT